MGSNVIRKPLVSAGNRIYDDDSDIDEADDPPPRKIQRTSSRGRFNEQENNENNEDRGLTLIGQIKQTSKNQRFRTDQQEIENFDDIPATQRNNSSRSSITFTDTSVFPLIRNDINNVYIKLNNSMNENMTKFEKRLNRLANACLSRKDASVEQYRSSSDTGFESDVDFNGLNLLDIYAKNYGDYARQILRLLYKSDELCRSTLPSQFTHYSRKPLEKERLLKFHDAIRNKYRISKEKYDEFFTVYLRRKVVNFICDERKRQIRKKKQQILDPQLQALDQEQQALDQQKQAL
ncbi:unnamed protein product, partial [Rotaria socialis]